MNHTFYGCIYFKEKLHSYDARGNHRGLINHWGKTWNEYIRYKKTGWIRQAHQRLPRVGGLVSTFTEEGQPKACSPFIRLL